MKESKKLNAILNIFLLTSSKTETLREIQKKNIKWKNNQEFTKPRLHSIFNSVKFRYRGLWPVNKQDEKTTVLFHSLMGADTSSDRLVKSGYIVKSGAL